MAASELFLDTNVFIRFLTDDEPRMSDECRRLFERAMAGELALSTSHITLAEVAWTLRTYYGLPRPEIAAALRDLLGIPGLHVEHFDTLVEALDLYGKRNVDFADAYNAAECRRRGLDRICSYDRDFDSLPVERVEPGAVVG